MSDGEFEEQNALFQVRLLAQRVETLGREKEEIEVSLGAHDTRLRKIENIISVGWGMLIVFGVLGAVLGFLFSNHKIIFKPWFPASLEGSKNAASTSAPSSVLGRSKAIVR